MTVSYVCVSRSQSGNYQAVGVCSWCGNCIFEKLQLGVEMSGALNHSINAEITKSQDHSDVGHWKVPQKKKIDKSTVAYWPPWKNASTAN